MKARNSKRVVLDQFLRWVRNRYKLHWRRFRPSHLVQLVAPNRPPVLVARSEDHSVLYVKQESFRW